MYERLGALLLAKVRVKTKRKENQNKTKQKKNKEKKVSGGRISFSVVRLKAHNRVAVLGRISP